MSIAAKVACALLVLLVSLPVSSRAESTPQPAADEKVVQEQVPQQSSPPPARKKKKPQFQTRFFSE